MAIAKVILNGEVQMDVTSDTVEANKLLSGETATKNDGTKVTGTFVAPDPVISSLSVTPTESEQIFSGAETNILESFMMSSYDTTNRTITADVDFSYLEYGATYHVEGKINYYPGSGQVNRTVTIDTDWVASENGEIPFTNDNGGSVSKVTLSKTQIIVYFSVSISSRWSIGYNMSDRRAFVFTRSVDGYKPVIVGGISSTYIGSAVPLRSNADMYKSEYAVYAPSGYYSSEALYTVPADEHTAPTINFDSNYGTIRATHNASDTIRNKHILSGTSNMFSDRQLPSLGASTYIPTESIQYISSYQWLTGSQTIAAIPSSYIIPSGTYSVTENGTYDIGSYASVDVSVAGGGSWPNDTVLSEVYIFQQRSSSFTVPSSISNGDLVAVTGAIGSFSGGTTTSFTIFNDEWTWDGEPHTTVVESIPGGISATFITTSSYISVTSWPAGAQNTIKVNVRFNKREHDSEYLAFLNKCIYGQYSNSTITNVPAEHFNKYGLLSNISMDAVSTVYFSAFADCYKLREATFMNASLIGSYAFQYDFSLSRVTIPNCDTICMQAFNSCTSLSSLNVENVKKIENGAFKSCIMLSEISLPVCSRIEAAAFSSCRNLNSVYSPKCGYFGGSAFWSCSSLTSINFDNCTTVGSSAFYNTALPSVNGSMLYDISQAGFASCKSLSYVSMPFVSILYSYAFNSNSNLTTVYAPTLKSVGPSAFMYCSFLENFEAGEGLSYIGSSAFGHCYSLSRFTVGASGNTFDIGSRAFWSCTHLSEFYIFGNTALSIGYPRIFAQAFNYCSSLFSVYLLTGSVVSLPNGSGIFASTPMVSSVDGRYGSIYVPENLYSDYISHASWSVYSERFVSLTETEINAMASSFYLRPTGGIWNSDTDLSGHGSIYRAGLTNRRLSDMIGHSVIFRLCPIKNPGSATVTIVKDFPLFSSMTIPNSPFSLSFDYISQSTGSTLCHYDFTINFSEMSYSYAFTALYGFYLDWILND